LLALPAAAIVSLAIPGFCLGVESNLLANGGFETAARLSPQRLARLAGEGVKFESPDPLLPLRWTWSAEGNAPTMRLVAEAHTGQRALDVTAPRGGNLHLGMGVIEVVPNATYRFGAWVRGHGKGAVVIRGNAFEGPQELARRDLAVSSVWSLTRGEVTIPGHIRTVSLQLITWGEAELTWDDVFFSAELPRAFDPDAVLNTKPQLDQDTLALVDFDSPAACRLENGAKITEEGGGRFGKGLRLERSLASSALIPLSIERMPVEGTLEYWFAPDEVPSHIHCYAVALAGDLDVMTLQADTSDSLRLSWRTSEGLYDPPNSIACESSLSRSWFRKGQWHHVAVQWDKEAVRYYLDGVLVQYSTDRPLPFFRTPSGIKLGSLYSVYAWSGCIDEVRLSKVQRYGPFIPVGAKWSPFVVAEKEAGGPKRAGPAKLRPAPDYAAQRAKQIATIPAPPAGALTFSAADLKPLLRDDPDFKIEKEIPAPGLTTARIGHEGRLLRDPDNDGGFWKLDAVRPGRYYVGVWYESGKAGAEATESGFGALAAYLNGRILQLSTTSDPLQAAPGVYFAEAQTADAASLRPGDEIAVLPESIRALRLARLCLYPTEPVRGRGWVPENFGATWFSRDTALRLNLDAAFNGSARDGFRQVQDLNLPSDLKRAADGTRALATCRISNPLPVPLTVEYTAEVKAYFREPVGEDRATVALQPHERITREIPFTVIPDSRRYTIECRARAVRPPALGWPAADTIAFFPGVRQSLPWPDPFTAKDQRSVEFGGPLPGPRVCFSLGGAWQSAFTTSLSPPVPPPAGLEWTPRSVPFPAWQCRTDSLTPKPHGIYLRRVFTIPEQEAKKNYRLCMADAADEATVYVNGRKVGNVRGGQTPLACDVTGALRPGANEILIVIRDVLAIMDPAYVNPASPTPSVAYLDAPGGESWTGPAIGAVSIESSPLVAAQDLLVIPSLRKRELAARLALVSHEPAVVKARVEARVLDAGRSVLELGSREVSLEPGKSVPLVFTMPWKDPVLWGPENPKLYTLAVETVSQPGGKRLDLLRQRFGFRESWVDKDRLYFNGVPVRLKGSTCQGGGGVNVGDIQWSRGTPYPDFMDEFGYPVSFALAAIFNSSSLHNVERDRFWEAARDNVLAGAARYGNHPSIIAWDLSNEWLSFLDYGGGDRRKGSKRFKALDDALKALDPSRWTFFDGDEDLQGLHDTFSTHYMLESANPHPIYGFGFRGHSNYFPDGAFFHPLDRTLEPGQEVAVNVYRGTSWRVGEKPLMDTENLWKVSAYMPPGPCKFADEDDVLGPGIDCGRGPIAWMWKQNLDGHRDLGVSAVCNYTPVTGVARRGHSLQCFIMPDHTHHCYAGAKIERSYSLHNDRFVPSDFVFRWELLDPSGKAVAGGTDRRAMQSGGLQRGKFSLVAPDVAARTRYTLRMAISADGAFAYGEERDLDIWPSVAIPTGTLPLRTRHAPRDAGAHAGPHAEREEYARRLTLFDPAGTTAAALRSAGVAFASIGELTAPADEPSASVLVIGEGALKADTAVAAGKLAGYVAAGGRIVVLAQDRLLPGLPVKTTLESREWVSMPMVRTPQHPLVQGVTSWDLHFWSPDHISAKGAYSKPDGGPFVTLVDSGTDTGLEWAEMMECYSGRGLYLLNQLPLAGKYHVEPMARELLHRLIQYAAGEKAFRAPDKKLLVSAGPASLLVAKLGEAGVAWVPVGQNASLTDQSILLIDAAELPPDFQPPAAWRTALAAGAALIVHGARPEHDAFLTALASTPVALVAQPFGMWEGRAYRNGHTWLTPGLSQIDLYWKRYDGSEGASRQAEDPSLKIDDLVHYSVAAVGAIEHIFPGGLVEIPVGRGRLILDQLRWETPQKQLDKLSSRVLSSMMMGLGIAIAPYTPARELPGQIAYQPIDLKTWANRGLADEVAGDGEGGWSDEGPDCDLRSFPTGQQTFGGVPFSLGPPPHSAIVLRSDSRPFAGRMPAGVTIPIGSRVEGLCFLHGMTHATDGEEAGRYQIEYADGRIHDIPLVAGENVRDWTSPPALLPREKGTRSRVAWTGTTKAHPVVCVFQMLWVNPYPETPVRAVRFANPKQKACPILMALTAVVRDEKAAADRAAAHARAKELLDQSTAALDAGKDAAARQLLEKAVREDASLDAAYRALGGLCEKLKDEDGVLAAYRAWAAAGAKTPLPYNRIGEILEKRKDNARALEAYQRSLQIEWNQPPIIEAKKRLEKLLAE
jgi:hypothetical protein